MWGQGPKLCIGPGLGRKHSSQRMNKGQWMVQTQNLLSKIQVGGQSKEEYLLGHDKYSSNMYSGFHSDLPRSSSDKNAYHKHIGRMGTQKYLRKNCYHCIEFTAATFLTTFMWRRPLNSIALVTTTHRRPERVFDGTGTRVGD